MSVQAKEQLQYIERELGFNTSYVSVQVFDSTRDFVDTKKFQYILCVGSSMKVKAVCLFPLGFNTSYVSVQVSIALVVFFAQSSFNTSYVSVQVMVKLMILFWIVVSIHPMCRFKLWGGSCG